MSGAIATDVDALIDGVIGREGRYANQPNDKGGPTCWGVTQQVARSFGYTGPMATMPRATAVSVYRQRYWTAPHLDQVAAIAPSVAAELFDTGINMGVGAAGTFLQRALNALNRGGADYPDVPTDGLLGALTIQHLRDYVGKRPAPEGPAVLLWVVRALRTAKYIAICESDHSQEVFGYGWVARQVRSAGAA